MVLQGGRRKDSESDADVPEGERPDRDGLSVTDVETVRVVELVRDGVTLLAECVAVSDKEGDTVLENVVLSDPVRVTSTVSLLLNKLVPERLLFVIR